MRYNLTYEVKATTAGGPGQSYGTKRVHGNQAGTNRRTAHGARRIFGLWGIPEGDETPGAREEVSAGSGKQPWIRARRLCADVDLASDDLSGPHTKILFMRRVEFLAGFDR